MLKARAGGRHPGLLIALLAVGCAGPASAPVPTNADTASPRTPADIHRTVVDDTPRLLVITAMQSELDPLLALAEVETTEVISGRTHYLGELAGQDVVLMAGGVSMVNTTMSTQEAIHHFAITGIVFSGIAGCPSPHLGIGDVVIPAQWAEYQEHAFAKDGTGMPNTELGSFGMMHPRPVRVTRQGGEPNVAELRLWFPVDASMLASAERAAMIDVPLERCNREGHCVDGEPRIVVGGNGVSGPTFVDHGEYSEWVWDTFRPDALDMETAAVGHVAYSNEVPYIAVRGISDLAGGNPVNQVSSFGRLAARNAAAVAVALLGALGDR